LQNLELRRVRADLTFCYKLVFGHVKTRSDVFQVRNNSVTMGHSLKLYKQHCNCTARSTFFTERVVNVWNALPSDEVDFSSLNALGIWSLYL